MLLLTIVAFFATTAFYSAAKHRGLQPGRAAMLPFVVLGVLLIFAHFGELLLTKLLVKQTNQIAERLFLCLCMHSGLPTQHYPFGKG